MRRIFGTRRRKIVAGVVLLIAIATAAVAGAYFLASGSTSTTTSIGASPVELSLSAASDGVALYPGGNPATISVHISNPTLANGGHGDLHVSSLSGSVDTLPVGCDPAWFTVTPAAITPTTLAPGDSMDATASVSLNESGTDQTACAGSTARVVVNAVG